MVALFESRESTTVYIAELGAPKAPVTFVLFDGRRNEEIGDGLSTLNVFSTGMSLDGDPTWEDAAWQ